MKKNENKDKLFAVRSPRFRLDQDVILPPSTRNQIEECMARIKYHHRIYVDWNFYAVDPTGASLILNFYGPPGTGKTMAAEALAGTLGIPFIHIGIAELESKFMGETARNIQAAFSEAHASGALLFFDEADTLLGSRLSSVTQGVDNEVNAMKSTMLIELERFEGVAVFATNFAKNYDSAFRSRISHHVHFALPDQACRTRLWQKMLVPDLPLAGDPGVFAEHCASLSDGFSGREILTCMRLALPKALLKVEQTGEEAALQIVHIEEAIAQIRQAQHEIGHQPGRVVSDQTDASVTRRLLGMKVEN